MKPDFFTPDDVTRMERDGVSADDLRRMEASPMVECKKCSTVAQKVSRWLIWHQKCPYHTA